MSNRRSMPTAAAGQVTAVAGAALLLVVVLLAGACNTGGGDGQRMSLLAQEAGRTAVPPLTPTPTPTPLPPPSIEVPVDFAADQGLEFTGEGRVQSPVPGRIRLTLAFGDGVTQSTEADAAGRFTFAHRYATYGPYELTVTAAGPTGTATRVAGVQVAPRKVVFIQGMNSGSRCPDGEHFLDRAPAWLAESFAADAGLRESLVLDAGNFAYFSYSGEYCEGASGAGGSAPSYRWGDTCESIDNGSAVRLKALIDELAPSRVTIVAHSMGGLVAAYLAASEPEWAREHLVSIATFDSPLGGIDGFRAEVLALYRMRRDGCGRSSAAMDDLRAGSEVTKIAAGAARVVPFFTLDGDSKESAAFGIAEAVPNGRTEIAGAMLHLTVAEEHSAIWSDAPGEDAGVGKAAFVACALVADARRCQAVQ